MVFGGGNFGGDQVEGRAFMNVVSALYKRNPGKLHCPSFHVREKTASVKQEEGSHQSLDLPAP